MAFHVPYNPPKAHVQSIFYRHHFYRIHKRHLHKFIMPTCVLIGNLYKDCKEGRKNIERTRIIKKLENIQLRLFKMYDLERKERRKKRGRVDVEEFSADDSRMKVVSWHD